MSTDEFSRMFATMQKDPDCAFGSQSWCDNDFSRLPSLKKVPCVLSNSSKQKRANCDTFTDSKKFAHMPDLIRSHVTSAPDPAMISMFTTLRLVAVDQFQTSARTSRHKTGGRPKPCLFSVRKTLQRR